MRRLYKARCRFYNKSMYRNPESGMAQPLIVVVIILALVAVGFGGFGAWAYINYNDQKNNVDTKIAAAVADAKQQQIKTDQSTFAQQEKSPTRQIVGPADLGQVTLSYPKNWSVYIDRNGTNNSYEAYYYPLAVPPTNGGTAYALRVSVLNTPYDTALGGFNDSIKSGKLTAQPVTAAGVDGIRLDGTFANNFKGAMVIFKIRDKTLEVSTQSQDFVNDFNDIIKTLTFNK